MEVHSMENSLIQAIQLFDEAEKFIREYAEEKDAYNMEKEIHRRVMEIGREMMAYYFSCLGTGDVGSEIFVDGVKLKRQADLREKTIFSIFGKLKVMRTYYHSRGQKGVSPLDEKANLPKRCYSYLFQEFMSILGIKNPFADTTADLEKFFGQKIEKSRVEVVIQEANSSYEQFYEEKEIPDEKTEGEISVVSFDGKGVPMIKEEAAKLKSRLGKGEKRQKKKEALVGVSYTIDPNERTAEEVAENLLYPEKAQKENPKISNSKKNTGKVQKENPETSNPKKNPEKVQKENPEASKKKQPPKAQNIRRMASLEKPKTEVMKEIVNDFKARNPSLKRPLVAVMDGALSLWKQLAVLLIGINYIGILDIIHVKDYLWDAANCLFGEEKKDAEERKKWVHKQLLSILEGRVGRVIGALKQTKTKRKKLKKHQIEVLDKVIRYFENHRKWMKYDEYLAAGYPIASGVVESACGSVVKKRMEGTGRRWSIEGAESVLLLRSIYYSSEHWKDYWLKHMEIKHSCLYGRAALPEDYTKNSEFIKLKKEPDKIAA